MLRTSSFDDGSLTVGSEVFRKGHDDPIRNAIDDIGQNVSSSVELHSIEWKERSAASNMTPACRNFLEIIPIGLRFV
jgi:hypothetical protein